MNADQSAAIWCQIEALSDEFLGADWTRRCRIVTEINLLICDLLDIAIWERWTAVNEGGGVAELHGRTETSSPFARARFTS